MRVAPWIALLPLTLTLAGCGSSATYDERADKAAIRGVISSAWEAESAGDESTACLYYTEAFIEEQNRIWEARTPGASEHRKDCATGRGSHPYLRLTNAEGGFDNDRVRFAWTRVSSKSRAASAQPILPGGSRCLNSDCNVVISLVIHLVDNEEGGWLIDDLDATACVVNGSCVPLDNRQVM